MMRVPGSGERRAMFGAIVVGTDGSDTAKEAVRRAPDVGKGVGAPMALGGGWEPVSSTRLREEQREVPPDLEWMVNPREDVDATLKEGADQIDEAGAPVKTY